MKIFSLFLFVYLNFDFPVGSFRYAQAFIFHEC